MQNPTQRKGTRWHAAARKRNGQDNLNCRTFFHPLRFWFHPGRFLLLLQGTAAFCSWMTLPLDIFPFTAQRTRCVIIPLQYASPNFWTWHPFSKCTHWRQQQKLCSCCCCREQENCRRCERSHGPVSDNKVMRGQYANEQQVRETPVNPRGARQCRAAALERNNSLIHARSAFKWTVPRWNATTASCLQTNTKTHTHKDPTACNCVQYSMFRQFCSVTRRNLTNFGSVSIQAIGHQNVYSSAQNLL